MITSVSIEQFKREANRLGSARIPFFFLTDFELQKPFICPLDQLPENISIATPSFYRHKATHSGKIPFIQKKEPVSREVYQEAFDFVQKEIQAGNTYLCNLTFPGPVQLEGSLADVFEQSRARYRLHLPQQFVVFSPETFVLIEEGMISTFPMKGTIDARIPDAARRLLDDPKETAEHYTIVDLLRNDLSRVSEEVRVRRFRYLDRLETSEGPLLQCSSEIVGRLPANYHANLGDLLLELLPAGSVSGAPKLETLRIIREAEKRVRGYYTGVFGLFDGQRLESAVLIRYIEHSKEGTVYNSGGGITSQSDPESEYRELIQKIYVPFRNHTH